MTRDKRWKTWPVKNVADMLSKSMALHYANAFTKSVYHEDNIFPFVRRNKFYKDAAQEEIMHMLRVLYTKHKMYPGKRRSDIILSKKILDIINDYRVKVTFVLDADALVVFKLFVRHKQYGRRWVKVSECRLSDFWKNNNKAVCKTTT